MVVILIILKFYFLNCVNRSAKRWCIIRRYNTVGIRLRVTRGPGVHRTEWISDSVSLAD